MPHTPSDPTSATAAAAALAGEIGSLDVPPRPALHPIEQDSGVVVGSHGVFDVVRHSVKMASAIDPFAVHTLRMPNWVTVVAIREDERVVMVRQHRYGVRSPMLETPGGVIDPGEAPRQAAERELAEETGHQGGNWRSLGWAHPNPALQDNRIFFWLASGVRQTSALNLDEHEQVETVLLDLAEVRRQLDQGSLQHALSALALERALRQL